MRYILSRIPNINMMLISSILVSSMINVKISLLLVVFAIMIYKFNKDPEADLYKKYTRLKQKQKKYESESVIAHNNYNLQLKKYESILQPKSEILTASLIRRGFLCKL
jgi:hypothetical protein